MANTVLQVNGKSYDAVTGRRIDGIITPKKVDTPSRAAQNSTDDATYIPVKRIANHTKVHSPQKAQTLMRKAVKKPSAGLKKQVRVTSELAHTNGQVIAVKHSVEHVDPVKAQHAQRVEKHAQVHRFHGPKPVAVTFAPVAVRHAPDIASPAKTVATAQHQNSTDIFEQAIQNATHYVDIAAHKAHYKKKARRHTVSVAAGTLALMIIGGFMTYINTPGLQLKIAGVRAGVATNTPHFAASGFRYNGVAVEGNRRVIGLTTNSGDFALTQESTSWTGDQMIEHVSAVQADGTPTYRTVHVGNDTAYRLNDTSQATWVKNGTWYQLSGKTPLSDDQLRALVANS